MNGVFSTFFSNEKKNENDLETHLNRRDFNVFDGVERDRLGARTPGEIHIDFATLPSDPALKRVEFGLEASAAEIYFGAAVYFRAFDRNVLETAIERIGAFYSQIGGFAPYVGVDYSFMARGRR